MRSFRISTILWMTALPGLLAHSAGCTLDVRGTGDGLVDAGLAGMAGMAGMAGAGGASTDASVGGSGASSSGGGAQGGFGGVETGGAGGASGLGGAAGSDPQGGTGGSATTKDCADGIDNDLNGAVDCDDDQCRALGYACLPPVPEEWAGFFRVRVQANADPSPLASPCPGGGQPERYLSGKAGQAQCGPCSCGPLQNVQCAAAGIACDFESSNCSNPQPRPELENFQCHNLPHGSVSCRLTGQNPVAEHGSCVPSPEVPDFPNKLPFTDVIDACYFDATTGGGGCAGQDVCARAGAGDYTGAVCIMLPNENAVCPPRWDKKPAVHMYKPEDSFDHRTCEPCTCQPDPSAIQCVGGSYEVFDKNGCDECGTLEGLWCDDRTRVNSTDCKDLSKWADSETISIRANARPKAENGLCLEGGGKPTGYVEATKGVTLCCLSL